MTLHAIFCVANRIVWQAQYWTVTFRGRRDIWMLQCPFSWHALPWWCWSVAFRGRRSFWWCPSVTFLGRCTMWSNCGRLPQRDMSYLSIQSVAEWKSQLWERTGSGFHFHGQIILDMVESSVIVKDASYDLRYTLYGDFSWQAQHLVMSECRFSWQAQHALKFW